MPLLTFDEFKGNIRYCKPWKPSNDEDYSQDVDDNKRAALADARKQYEEYLRVNGEGLAVVVKGSEVKFDRNAYHKEYMRGYMRKQRAKPKFCPHCGKPIK